jgi:hypothetical protein
MAKGFERREYRGRQGMQYGDHPEAQNLQKLADVVTDLYMCTDDRDRTRLWSTASRLLSKTKAEKERTAKIMLEKRVGALSKLVTDLQQEAARPKVGRAAMAESTAVSDGSTEASPAVSQDVVATERVAGDVPPAAVPQAVSSAPSSDNLKQALKAFKKRLKLTRLDEESRLGNRTMTGGHKSAVVAIMPPREFPRGIWEELVRQGRLKPAGSGFYQLVDGA